MGDQSFGKSSVLESVSGIPFPRGSGLVTRCATELRMKKAPQGTAWSATIKLSWSQPQPSSAGKVDSYEEIGERISKLTEALLLARGTHATFEAEHSIVIDLIAPNVPDLTVIDLPGIVRTQVTGQTGDVMKDVDHLLDRYLKQERTIILCVIPSNVDIATVDILERVPTKLTRRASVRSACSPSRTRSARATRRKCSRSCKASASLSSSDT